MDKGLRAHKSLPKAMILKHRRSSSTENRITYLELATEERGDGWPVHGSLAPSYPKISRETFL